MTGEWGILREQTNNLKTLPSDASGNNGLIDGFRRVPLANPKPIWANQVFPSTTDLSPINHAAFMLHACYRPRTKYDGNVIFSVCLSVHQRGAWGYPRLCFQFHSGGGGTQLGLQYPRPHPPPGQDRDTPSPPTPPLSQDQDRGTPPRRGQVMPRALSLLRFPGGGLSCFI